ncbi:MAG: class I SAM-dependent methyltransferase [Azospirillum sp.]|nr:class I SAM-dependent methyltransferase [Azospirillum sp.]
MNTDTLRNTYAALAKAGEDLDLPPYFRSMTNSFLGDSLWKEYLGILALAPSLEGRTVLDFGCKFGHTLPILHALGASKCIGVDVDDEYLATGNRAFQAIGFPGAMVKSDDGYMAIESETVDFVLVNEVISHVNPCYLDTLYSELARVLKPGGHILISDGNNRANGSCVVDLRQLYAAWENGPEGADTGRDVVNRSFRQRRRDVIAKAHPTLAADRLDYLADTTSGLFGDRLLSEVGKYLSGKGWVERRFRSGVCPTNPMPGGVVMERAFHPIQVELSLAEFGIAAKQVSIARPGTGSTLGRLKAAVKQALTRVLYPPEFRGESWAFQILGRKLGEAPAKWELR